MEHGILLSGADNIDFMIHGVFKYSFFGHEVWITTTHVCVLIVMLIIIGFAIARQPLVWPKPEKCRKAFRMWWS